MKKITLTFAEGIWFAVECLVIEYDQPTMARHILMGAGIKKKEALAILAKTKYCVEDMTDFLNKEFAPKKTKRI